jgi:hypothetical protein
VTAPPATGDRIAQTAVLLVTTALALLLAALAFRPTVER